MAEHDDFDLAEFGDPAAPVEGPQATESLQRNADLSFLGEAAQDPVGAGTQYAEDLMRTGEGPGMPSLDDIRTREDRFAQFREEHGLSRASRELPEMFGEFNIDPRQLEMREEAMNIMRDPDAGFLQRFGAANIVGQPPPTRFQPSGVGAGLSTKDALLISAAGMTMFDPAEIAQMLTSVDPDTGERKWPQFAITQAPDGAFVVTNTNNNAQAVINRPGMSQMDTMQALGVTAMFTPAGRITGAVAKTAPRIAVGAGTAAATEAGIQQLQETAGGEFDWFDVGLTGAMGPLVDLARPFIGGMQRLGRFIGSYIPENLGQKVGQATGLGPMLERVGATAKAQALNFAERASEYLESARPAILMTQDAVPEAHTPFRQILLKMVERLPLTGTGAARKAQQQQRVELLQHLADRYQLRPNTNYGATVIDDLNRNAGDALGAARTASAQAVGEMAEQPVDIILRDFRLTIRDIIENEARYGDMANKGLLNLLNRARNSVWQGGAAQDFGRNFGLMDDWLQRLRMHASTAPPPAQASLNTVADALEADMRRHAAEEGGEAGARWLAAQDEVAQLVRNAESRTLQNLMSTGEVDEGVIRNILKRADPDEMTQLYESMTPTGRDAARNMLLGEGLTNAGWRNQMPEEMIVDPDKLLKWMDRPNVTAQLDALFPEAAEREMLEGMREYLRMTRAAQQTGQGVGMAASGGFGQSAANTLNFITLGLVGFGGQAYQSAPVRNLLLRLYHVRSDQRMKDAVMRELTPILMGIGRQEFQRRTAGGESYDREYLSAEAQDVMDEQNALGTMMDSLREATGIGAEGTVQ